MIKYFCDGCGNELTPYEYNNASQVTITDPDEVDSLKIYNVCPKCEIAIRKFIQEGRSKAGEHNDM